MRRRATLSAFHVENTRLAVQPMLRAGRIDVLAQSISDVKQISHNGGRDSLTRGVYPIRSAGTGRYSCPPDRWGVVQTEALFCLYVRHGTKTANADALRSRPTSS